MAEITESLRRKFSGKDVRKWVRNIDTHMWWEEVGGKWFPVTGNETEYDSSWVVSAYSALILYSRQEMHKLPSYLHFLSVILWPLSFLMKFSKMNAAVSFNNWLLSTNIFSPGMDDEIVNRATELVSEHPESMILVRSINSKSNPELLKKFMSAGWALIPSRQVYIFDFDEVDPNQRRDFKRDKKLIADTSYKMIGASDFKKSDFPRVVELYEQLYLGKHSQYNPAYTADYFELCLEESLMDFIGLRDSDGILQGFAGIFSIGDTMTVPFCGYEISKPQNDGLYRMLMATCISKAQKSKLLLNMSSGASGFKLSRGAKPEIEFSAAYIAHLPFHRRAGFRILQGILNTVAIPLIRYFKL